VTNEEKCDRCGHPVEWIEPEEHDRTSGLTFGEALELCRQGKRIYRSGWNGRNQFVYYQPGSTIPFSRFRAGAVREFLVKKAGKPSPFNMNDVVIMGHFDIMTTAGVIQCGWLASQGDMQADDWEVLE
jgi:hypothetical protein